ncbi:tetratricopeptide repeat-containing sensor histidine kinase [Formosa sp. A9]|uniref:tetratricopeptide repeat-containing sensor histidine kinase n=1 Tax=Formosa sp. A9 TaxID=3442641 RepID=UPI003EBCC794
MAQRSKKDSVAILLSRSSNYEKYDYDTRLLFAKRAKQYAEQSRKDSLVLKSNLQIADLYKERKFFDLFLKANHDNLKYAERVGDSVYQAKIYSKMGDFYEKILSDSAYYYYYKSEKIYRRLHDAYNTASILLSIAIIQKNEKDFIGSEVTSVEAIKLLDSLPKIDKNIRKKAYLYNNLGLVFDQLEQQQEAINYHNKALVLKQSLEGDNSATIDNSMNNLGAAYKNSGNYKTALELYKSVLSNKNLKQERPSFYALVLDNYANTRYQSGDKEQTLKLYTEALNVCDSIGESYNSIIINQHIAEYYNDMKQKDSAKKYAYRAKNISEQYHNDDLLKSLLLLSKIESDSAAVQHYKAYIHLNDSLQKSERAVRNKFARIRYETKEIEQKNIKISKERSWLIILSGGLLITFFLLFIIITQRNRNKSLQFKQQQQQANEEIYNLMLLQQDKIDEARTMEKRRISEELHDGILSRLFGTRLSLDSLNFSTSAEAIQTRGSYLDELKTIEQDIRKVSHDLNIDFVSNSGYIDIVKTLLEKQALAYNIMAELKHDDNINWDAIPNKTKIHLYRIIQEAIQNVFKHAKASKIEIKFYLENQELFLEISDDGIGFDLNKSKQGIGLKNMKSRLKEIHGHLKVISEKQNGTTLIINTPINNT